MDKFTQQGAEDPQRWAEFNELIRKMADLGWVERASVNKDFGDVRFTATGIAGLQNINKLERAFGGFKGAQADILFFIAQRADEP